MRNLTRSGVIAAVAATALCAFAPAPASAVPVTGAQTVKADIGVTEVRYRRHYVRRGGGAGAALGVFGAIAGAAIAGGGGYYNDYDYGYPANYGYGYGYPAYGYDAPVYAGPRYVYPRGRATYQNRRGNWHDGGN